MEKRIELERRGKKPQEITELILDNSRATQIEGLTDEYTSLESLSLINVGLTSMKGFPKLRSLKRLELSDNRINGGLDVLQGSPLLTQINISGNKIKDLTALEPLKTLECLTHLDLFNNPLSNEEDEFRAKVFKMLPNLAFLDGTDADDMEDEEGSEFEDNLALLENNIVNPDRAGTPPGGASGGKIGSNSSGGKNGNAAAATEEEDDDDEDDLSGEEEEDDEEDGEDEEEEDEDEDGEEEEEEEDDEPGLADIYRDNIEDGDGDDEDFDEAAEQAEPDDDVIEDDEESEEPSEKRRKTEGGKNA